MFLENRQPAGGTINGRLAAVRRLTYEAADAGLLSPELAGIRRRGHVSVETTERYLGCKQRIRGAVNDCIGIEP
jgi:hypothetical protein